MKIAALSTSTLDEIMRQEMGPDRMSVGAGVNFGPLRFCIRQLSEEGRIELVGMSVRPESAMDEGVSDPTQT